MRLWIVNWFIWMYKCVWMWICNDWNMYIVIRKPNYYRFKNGIRILWQPPSSRLATYRTYLFLTMKNNNDNAHGETVVCLKILSIWLESCLQKFLYTFSSILAMYILWMFHKQQSGAATQTLENSNKANNNKSTHKRIPYRRNIRTTNSRIIITLKR